VDYYGPLAQIYRHARFTLNLTSLLLPHGLTQRNFDVWAAGGFLLTDHTPGLAIFDPKLAQEVAFTTPTSLHDLIRRLDSDASLPDDLKRAWRDHILKKHLYSQRIIVVLETVQGNPP
jgi:spore maturation protein CgeB